MNNSILQISPTFLSGAQRLHDLLAPVTIICAFAGLMIIVVAAMHERHMRSMWGMFIKMTLAVWLLGSLGSIGDMLNGAVISLMPQLGWGSFPGGVAQDYRDAIARKWGTQSATNGGWESGGSNGQSRGTSGSWDGTTTGPTQSTSGVQITHYGAPNDSTPDPNSANGIGNHNNQLTAFQNPGIPASAALSQSVASQYGLSVGQAFTLQASNGQSYQLIYADTVPATFNGQDLGSRIDIYDPNSVLGPANEFSSSAVSINNGPILSEVNTGSVLGTGFNAMDPRTWFTGIVNALVFLLSIIALGCMMIMTLFQQFLYVFELALAPLFLGLWLIPGLSNLGTRFFTSLASIILWPLGWIVADLGTKFFLDLAVSQNPSQSAANAGLAAIGGGGLEIVVFLILAIWVIGSSFVAPIIVSAFIITGGSGIAKVFAGTVGLASFTAFSVARNAGIGAVGSVISNGASQPVSPLSATRMNVPAENFARRPAPVQKET